VQRAYEPRSRNSRASKHRRQAYPYRMRQYPEPRPRDDRDAAKNIARDLADIAGQLASLKGEARAWLSGPYYSTLKLRLENAHAAVEAAAVKARRRVRLTTGNNSDYMMGHPGGARASAESSAPLGSRATDLLVVSPRSVLRAAAAGGCTPAQLIEPRR
jgi:hypothetical protein